MERPDPLNADPSRHEPVLVFGSGGHGKTVISALQAAGIPIEAVIDQIYQGGDV